MFMINIIKRCKKRHILAIGFFLLISGCSDTKMSNEKVLTPNKFEAREERALGNIGRVRAENVVGLNSKSKNKVIKVNIDKNTNYSGQFRTKENMSYGNYEAKIKIPKNDGLLSGFFLYNYTNENNYEIDLEVFFRDNKWQAKTTIYNVTHPNYKELHESLYDPEPEAVFKDKVSLAFDPTEDFNTYRINFQKEYISFEINGVEISRWNESFDFAPMKLYAGTFYSHWLNKDIYNSELDKDTRKSLRKNGIKAYDYSDTLDSKMNSLFGRSKNHVMEVKEIRVVE